MGIEGLLKFVATKAKRVNLARLKGKKVGIDGYVWLHKAVYSGNLELATNKEGLGFVFYFLHNINLLRKLGIVPIVVFDGDRLGSKNCEEHNRAFRREEKQKLANELMIKGETDKAKKMLISSIDINPEMVKKVTDRLNTLRVEYIVAPYEADAQLFTWTVSTTWTM